MSEALDKLRSMASVGYRLGAIDLLPALEELEGRLAALEARFRSRPLLEEAVDVAHHELRVTDEDWFLTHPLACRERGLADCPTHGAAARLMRSDPFAPGVYTVDLGPDGRLAVLPAGTG